jgi:hypothetical protein
MSKEGKIRGKKESKMAPKRAKAGEYRVYSEKENCANRY